MQSVVPGGPGRLSELQRDDASVQELPQTLIQNLAKK